MSDKVRTAAQIAEENAKNRMDPDKVATPVEIDFENVIVTPQEKLESHVINQDEATGFDIDKESDRFKTSKQAFSRIKNVYADGPVVIIEVEEGKLDTKTQAAILGTRRVTPAEALQRATALNSMIAHKQIQLADRKQAEEIVEATIEATLEAQENIMKAQGSTDEDIKRARKARLERVEAFEKAVERVRGEKDLQELQQMLLFKKVLKKLQL
jgi:hypothetical protein